MATSTNFVAGRPGGTRTPNADAVRSPRSPGGSVEDPALDGAEDPNLAPTSSGDESTTTDPLEVGGAFEELTCNCRSDADTPNPIATAAVAAAIALSAPGRTRD